MSKNSGFRPTWAEINLNNLAFNFLSSKQFIGPGYKYMAVVKADAYGHNAVRCAHRLQAEGIDWFGVALPEEAVKLRNQGITKPVLSLGGFWTGQEARIISHNITPVVYELEKAMALNSVSQRHGRITPIHIKIDTGMGRIGVRYEAFTEFIDKILELKNLRIEGLMTHFAAADNLSETAFTNLQISRFNAALKSLTDRGVNPEFVDLANSPGAIAHPASRGNLVRLGGILYGIQKDVLPPECPKPELRPVLSLFSRVSLLKSLPPGESIGYSRTYFTSRTTAIASVPIGYQDGMPRSLSNRCSVLIKGRFAPIVGRISMDWMLLDVTDIPDVKLNDLVTIIGTDGDSRIEVEELAAKANTIAYEFTCGIHERVRKKYVGSSKKSSV
ncbi:MAG: alanine racemase [Acidobacteria bacterium]|nr:alanine racemase [Acidobacteriota bacterium]